MAAERRVYGAKSLAFYLDRQSSLSHFWGIGELEEVQSRVNGIIELSTEINHLLRHPAVNETGQPLPRSELKNWHHLIGPGLAELPSRRHVAHKEVGLVHKIAFTLFHNAILLEKTGRLKNQIEGLRNFTQYAFRLKQQGDPKKPVTSAELRRISDLKVFVDRISNFGSLLYNGRLPSRRLEWAIELGPPEAGYALDLWSEVDTMYIDFIVRDTALDVQTKASRIRIGVEEQSAHPNDYLPFIIQRVDDVVLSHGRRECHSQYDRFFSILEKPIRRSRPLRRMLTEGVFSGKDRKSFELERADLVYGLGHWMVLLWNTPWSWDLCTCGIRSTHLANTCTRHSFLPYPKRSHWYPECHPSKLAGNRFELLGIALAEITLALPISVMLEQEDTTYLVGEELVSRKGLLSMLRERFGRDTITKAVSYCLEPDSAILGESLRPDHFEEYCQNIVLPLQTYYRTVNKHSQSASGKRLRGNEDLSRYYDRDEDSDLTECNKNREEDSSGYNEDECGDFLYENEDSSSHNEDEDGNFSNDNEDP